MEVKRPENKTAQDPAGMNPAIVHHAQMPEGRLKKIYNACSKPYRKKLPFAFVAAALFSFADLPALADQPEMVLDGSEISYGSVLIQAKAGVYAADVKWKGHLVVSPGGAIPPSEMSDFSRSAAKKGYIVYVVKYVGDIAALPLFGNRKRALTLGNAIADKSIRNLPQQLEEESDLPIFAFGHSLGGAALGSFSAGAGPFSSLALFGTSRLIETPDDVETNVFLLEGENDGVIDHESIQDLSQLFDTAPVVVPLVNHFCIVATGVGAEDVRAKDKKTELNQSECIETVIKSMDRAFGF